MDLEEIKEKAQSPRKIGLSDTKSSENHYFRAWTGKAGGWKAFSTGYVAGEGSWSLEVTVHVGDSSGNKIGL